MNKDTEAEPDADLDEDERVIAAATPGPWGWTPGPGPLRDADCAFIVRARTRWPALVAEVRRLRAALAERTAEHDCIRDKLLDQDTNPVVRLALAERDEAWAKNERLTAELAEVKANFAVSRDTERRAADAIEQLAPCGNTSFNILIVELREGLTPDGSPAFAPERRDDGDGSDRP